jgi:hypothetical protein
MPPPDGGGVWDTVSEIFDNLFDSDDDTDLRDAFRRVVRHPAVQDRIGRTIDRWKRKAAVKLSKFMENLDPLPVSSLERGRDVNASPTVVLPDLIAKHSGIGHQNLAWKGGKQFIAHEQIFGNDGTVCLFAVFLSCDLNGF